MNNFVSKLGLTFFAVLSFTSTSYAYFDSCNFKSFEVCGMSEQGLIQFLNYSFSREEVESLSDYSGYDYITINQFLRGDILKPEDGMSKKALMSKIEKIDNAFRKARTLPCEMILYRGMNFLLDKRIPEVGQVVENKAYLSTSFSRAKAENFTRPHGLTRGMRSTNGVLLAIKVPRNQKLIFMNGGISNSIPCEGEFLLPRNTRIKIVSSENQEFYRLLVGEVLKGQPKKQ